ncbi:hypothetical protein PG990_002867 [Apiospora arundinis]
MTTPAHTCSLSPKTALLQLGFLVAFSATINAISPTRKALRLCSTVLLACLTYLIQESLHQSCHGSQWRGLGISLAWIQLLSAIDLVTVSSAGPNYGIFPSLSLLWNLRRIGTPWTVITKDTTQQLPAKPRRADYFSFLLSKVPVTCILYLVFEIAASAPRPPVALIGQSKQELWSFSDLSAADVAFRIVSSVGFYISTAILLSWIHSTVMTIGVALNVWEPGSWFPLFGSVGEAYTIRKFWGTVWHQCLRRLVSGPADLICDSVLQIPRGTLFSRYSRLILAFAISGGVHHASDMAVGVPLQDAGGARFFVMQGLIIMVEDFVQYVARNSFARTPGRDRAFKRIGFFWVVCVMAWATPTWTYPLQRLEVDPAAMLPFRVVPLIRALFA